MSDAVFTRTFALDDGPRVRLRLARPADRAGIARLVPGQADLDVRRLLRFNPAERTVIAAFAPIDGLETLVGVAAIEHAPDADVDTLVVDERLTAGLGPVLVRALRDRARTRSRHVA